MNRTQIPTALLCAVLLPSTLAAGATPTDGPPPVTRVVVYPDRALVTRAREVPCADTAVATFRNLPAELDPSTLRAAASAAQVEGVSLSTRVLSEAHQTQVRDLEAKTSALRVRIMEEERVQERAAAQRSQAESLRDSMRPFINRELATEGRPNTGAWASGLDTTRNAIDEANAKELKSEVALRQMRRQLDELGAQLRTLEGTQPHSVSDVEVVVRCETRGPVRVELSYMAGGTTWAPLYEARASRARDAIDLTVLAQVTQATGEAWNDVEVVLSTATTQRDTTPPEPLPLHVGATVEERARIVLVRRDEEVRHLSVATPAAGPATTSRAPTDDEAPGMAAEAQGLSVQLKVPGGVDLPGDGRPTRLKVEELHLPATFSLVAVPKLVPHVFRSAEAVNQARYPLLPGRVDLFSSGSFLGTSRLPLVAQRDAIKLAFGIDESVKVRRVTLAEDKKDPSCLGSTRRMLYGYKVEVANFAASPALLTLQEHIPVSQMDEVKVVVESNTTTGFERAVEDGILTWKLPLKAKERREVELHFVVEIPSEYDSSAL